MQSLYDQKYSASGRSSVRIDINFTQMPSMDLAKQKDMLRQVLEYFMAAAARSPIGVGPHRYFAQAGR